MEEYKKKVISGQIDPRWPKPRVVKWLELGAIPAIVGMWIPDWAGQYIHKISGTDYIFPPLPGLPTSSGLYRRTDTLEGVSGGG